MPFLEVVVVMRLAGWGRVVRVVQVVGFLFPFF